MKQHAPGPWFFVTFALSLAACGNHKPTERVPTERVPTERVPTERVPIDRVPIEREARPLNDLPTDYILAEPEVIDLGIPSDFFQRDGRALAEYPDISSCHMQGMSFAESSSGTLLVLSCILFNPDDEAHKTQIGKSFMLAARMCDLVGCADSPKRTPDWRLHEITEDIPRADSERMSKMLLGKDTLADDERAVVHRMTHPSGLMYDPVKRGVWVANSGYAPGSYTHVMLLDADGLARSATTAQLVMEKHAIARGLSSVALIDERFLMASTWATSGFAIFDQRRQHAPVFVANPWIGTDDYISIEHCITWRDPYVICTGERKFEVAPSAPDTPVDEAMLADPGRDTIRVRQGRMQVLRVDVSRHPDVELQLVGYMRLRLSGQSQPTESFGERRYRKDENGKEVYISANRYGGYATSRTLTMEGVTLDADRRYMYFVPDDLPASKMVRMRLERR